MQLLFKAVACKVYEGKKLLLPGLLVGPETRQLKPGSKIKIETADGTFVETILQGTKPCLFDEHLMQQLALRVPSGFYLAIEVPDEIPMPGIARGGNVYLDDPGE
jgi:hypothetical protein